MLTHTHARARTRTHARDTDFSMSVGVSRKLRFLSTEICYLNFAALLNIQNIFEIICRLGEALWM
jgi:hypothetical protein